MNIQHLQRLKAEQLKAVEETKKQIEKIKKFKKDYEDLKDSLTKLPQKLSHDVMVPIGPLAFMPGQIIHTNEICVLLGDNWFVDRSTTQAVNIIDRRIAVIDQQVEQLSKQEGLLEPRIQYTSEFQDLAEERGDVFEIKEEYDPITEEKWKEEHRKRVKEYYQGEREARSKESDQELKKEEELWRRLDELEVEESRLKELERMTANDGDGIETLPKESTDDDNSGEDETEDSNEEDDSEEELLSQPTTIYFTHTKVPSDKKESSKDESDPGGVIKSPADIKNDLICRVKPKSILKTEKTVRPEKSAVKPTQVKFKDDKVNDGLKIKERIPVTACTDLVTERNTTYHPKETLNKPRKISKFKAQSMSQVNNYGEN